MSVTHPTTIRDAITNLVTGKIDAGGSNGKLVFLTAGNVVVATLTFALPSFGASSSGQATANPITSDTNAVGGTIAKAEMRDSNGNAIVDCSVTATGGGGDITLNSLVIGAGQQVDLSSLTYTAPP